MTEIEAKVKEGTASNVEKDRQTIMMIVHEAMARGVEFLPIDIYKSTAHSYEPEDGKIRMPFSALAGVGDAAAEQLAKAKDDGEVMAVRHKEFNIYGLQFHPESILTPDGLTIIDNFLDKVKRGIL